MKCRICIIILLSIGVSFSCSDELDLKPKTSWSGANFPTEATHVKGLLNGGYERLRSALQLGFLIYGEYRGDAFYNNAFITNIDKTINNSLDYGMSYASWRPFYEVIQQANLVLKYAPKLDSSGIIEQDDAEMFMGQAYTLRAYAYFYIARIWGRAPLILEPFLSDDDIVEYDRASLDDLFIQIHKDLKKGADLIPASSHERTKLTKAAAYTIDAHVYAWEHNYEKVVEFSDKVLNNSNYSLASLYNSSLDVNADDFIEKVQSSEYAGIFNKGDSKESIFELSFDLGDGLDTRFLTSYFSGTNPIVLVREAYAETFMDNDWRAIINNDLRSNSVRAIKYIIGFNSDVDTRNIVLLRLSDLYLLKAEALIHLSDANENRKKAMELVNTIRKRAGGPELVIPKIEYLDRSKYSQEDIKSLILKERKFELSYEGYRWFDLVRNGKAIEILREHKGLDLDPKAIVWPIHIEEIRRGKSIEQNEYYK